MGKDCIFNRLHRRREFSLIELLLIYLLLPPKARKTEEWVEKSGLEHTIVRPSFIVGEGRRGAQLLGLVTYAIPSLRGIEVHELARVFLRALERRAEVRNQILEGKSLWKLLE